MSSWSPPVSSCQQQRPRRTQGREVPYLQPTSQDSGIPASWQNIKSLVKVFAHKPRPPPLTAPLPLLTGACSIHPTPQRLPFHSFSTRVMLPQDPGGRNPSPGPLPASLCGLCPAWTLRGQQNKQSCTNKWNFKITPTFDSLSENPKGTHRAGPQHTPLGISSPPHGFSPHACPDSWPCFSLPLSTPGSLGSSLL